MSLHFGVPYPALVSGKQEFSVVLVDSVYRVWLAASIEPSGAHAHTHTHSQTHTVTQPQTVTCR